MSNTNSAGSTEPINPLTVMAGGKPLNVTLLTGEFESVKVRLLPVAKYPDFALTLGDEVGQVALFCEKDRKWAENLHPVSHDEIMIIGHGLNLSFFERWVSRQSQARSAVDPGLTKRLEKIAGDILREELQKRLPASLSPTSLPESPASLAEA